MFEHEKINHQAFCYYPRLGRVKHYVDLHFDERLNLEAIAAIAGLERTYFSRFFHQKTGVCFRDWLSWVRVNHAMELMAFDDRPITEIALEVGFQDLRTFERAVEKCTGHTPRSVKKGLRPPVGA